jgi:hypothetical protein
MLLLVGRGAPVDLGEVAVAGDGAFRADLGIPGDAPPGEAAIKMVGSVFDTAPCNDTGAPAVGAASCASYLAPFEIVGTAGRG